MYSQDSLAAARRVVAAAMPATPQQRWPLLDARLGAEVWVKHENHSPVGAFKLRGGLVYMEALQRREPRCPGVVSATRGNHGQSIGYAARARGIAATSSCRTATRPEKMPRCVRSAGTDRAWRRLPGSARARHRPCRRARPAHGAVVSRRHGAGGRDLLARVVSRGCRTATRSMCRSARARASAPARPRESWSPRTKIVGVVSARRPTSRSFRACRASKRPSKPSSVTAWPAASPTRSACDNAREREPLVEVTDAELAEAMRNLFAFTHNVAEGAGAAAFAAAWRERSALAGLRVGLALTGGNVDPASSRTCSRGA